mgnify:CR=1 FL=1
MELSTWLAFFAASWAISISPGAGAVAAMSAGLNHGFQRGYITTLGLVLGIWTQIVVVGVGLGAVVAASGTAFLVIKWAGVAYLVWLGIRMLRAKAGGKAAIDVPEGTQTGKTFRLRGKGIKGVRSGFPGDLFCHVVVETPVKLTEKQKDLLREFDQLTAAGGAKHSPQSKSWMDKVKEFFE